MLWMTLFQYPMLAIVQETCARVDQRDLSYEINDKDMFIAEVKPYSHPSLMIT